MSRARRATEEEKVGTPLTPTVPATWAQVDFEQAFDTVSVNNKKIPARAYLREGFLPVIDQGQAFIGGYTNDSTKAIDPGEDGLIVFGDHTRIFKRVTFLFAPGADGTKVLRPTLSSSAYAYYACLSLEFPNRGYSRHYSYLRKCKFPVAPKPEQDRIVSKVDELFSEIEEGERALGRMEKLVNRYRQSVLKAAVTGELTREWRESHKTQVEPANERLQRILNDRRSVWENAELHTMKVKGIKPKTDAWKQQYQEPTSPDSADAPQLPFGWTWGTLGQFAAPVERAIQSGPFGSNLLHSEFQASGKLVIGIDNVRDGYFSPGSQNRISDQKFAHLHKYAARPRDFLVTVMATIGRTCVLPDDIEPAIITKHVYRFTLDHDLVLPEFVNICVMGSPVVREQLFGSVQGQTRPGLNKDILVRIIFPLPPLEEQRVICDLVARIFSDLSPLKEVMATQQRASKSLRQSVLRAAFSGSLVPQDSSDEPASLLMERLANMKRALHGQQTGARGAVV